MARFKQGHIHLTSVLFQDIIIVLHILISLRQSQPEKETRILAPQLIAILKDIAMIISYQKKKKKTKPVNRQEKCDIEKLSFFANPVLLLITWSSNPALFLKASLTKIQLLWNSQECGSCHKKIPV